MRAQLLSSTMRLFSSHMKRIRSRSRVLEKLFVRMFFNHCNLSDTVRVWKTDILWHSALDLLFLRTSSCHVFEDWRDEGMRGKARLLQRTLSLLYSILLACLRL
ncbi:hypothetical protein AVEN_65451-1 [Araneus ventricosus]|uniref:Uncharacterized protein n=1 Tax=Araneus ventricosus TaxID=182803 RepID=A0A4Y2IIC6_ARAVE|nr:hypothetical protein AVEN_65451-1 [Araneus ventricosus]